jgi:hypothetical protein
MYQFYIIHSLVCFLPSYLAFIYLISLLFCFTFFFWGFIYICRRRADPQVLVAHIQRARNSTSHSLLMSESTHPPPPPPGFGFAPSTAAENEASVSPSPGFTPSIAPADEVRVSPASGFAPSTETVADEVRVSNPPPPGFADQEGLQAGIVLPPAWGVSLRALTDDLVLPTLSIRGPATKTRRSDRIAGICHSVPKKKLPQYLLTLLKMDVKEEGL